MAPTWALTLGSPEMGLFPSPRVELSLIPKDVHFDVLDSHLPFCFTQDAALILGLLPAGEMSE